MKKHFISAILCASLAVASLVYCLIYKDTQTALLAWISGAFFVTICFACFCLYYDKKPNKNKDELKQLQAKYLNLQCNYEYTYDIYRQYEIQNTRLKNKLENKKKYIQYLKRKLDKANITYRSKL